VLAGWLRKPHSRFVSSKGRLVGVSGDDDVCEVTVEWPSSATLEESGLSRDDIAPYRTIMEPLATSVGLRFTFTTDDDGTTTLRFSR
jgi:hypothetical protein